MGRINPVDYTELLKQSYQAIKSVNPEMIVVSGGLTPAGNVGNAAIDDIDYLNQMYALGATEYFDAVGAHPAGFNCPWYPDCQPITAEPATAIYFLGPFTNRHHSWCFLGTMESYRSIMVINGDEDKKVMVTKFGWGVSDDPQPGFEYARDNTDLEQAKWIIESFMWCRQQSWTGPMFLWNLDYGITAPGTELAIFGIIGTPAYDTLVLMPK
ncbi:MAG: hypothetical protein KDF65_00490, partial [Anaerolineae bacterium]|nr:hypothetical protein [Anaerolineae bacterium]